GLQRVDSEHSTGERGVLCDQRVRAGRRHGQPLYAAYGWRPENTVRRPVQFPGGRDPRNFGRCGAGAVSAAELLDPRRVRDGERRPVRGGVAGAGVTGDAGDRVVFDSGRGDYQQHSEWRRATGAGRGGDGFYGYFGGGDNVSRARSYGDDSVVAANERESTQMEIMEKLRPDRDLQCYFFRPSAVAALSAAGPNGFTVSGSWRQQFDWVV